MSSDLTFITNEHGKFLTDRFTSLLGDNTRFFEVSMWSFAGAAGTNQHWRANNWRFE